METKHTPGKWQYVQEGIDAYGIIELDGTSIMHIQALRNSTGASCLKANAALIAQAPDLLAERDRLKAINAELVAALAELAEIGAAGIISRQGTGIPAWNAFDAVKDIARAALARANKQHQSNDKEC